MKLKITKTLDIERATKKADRAETISSITGVLAFAVLFLAVSASEFETEMGKSMYSTTYYVCMGLAAISLMGVSYVADGVKNHIRGLIEDSVHNENEKAWGRK